MKLLLCIVDEGIVLQLTRDELNLGILKVDIHAESRDSPGPIVSAMADSYACGVPVSLVTYSTTAAATVMNFFFTHVSLQCELGEFR